MISSAALAGQHKHGEEAERLNKAAGQERSRKYKEPAKLS